MKVKNVLLLEDNVLDIILIKESLARHDKLCNIKVLKHPREITNYLENLLVNQNNKIPDLIIGNDKLIINNGVNILFKMNDISNFYIPVIILTSSKTNKKPQFIKNTCCYINKPLDVKEFLVIIKKIKSCWLDLVN